MVQQLLHPHYPFTAVGTACPPTAAFALPKGAAFFRLGFLELGFSVTLRDPGVLRGLGNEGLGVRVLFTQKTR